jgi:hypothetical protein
MARSIEMPLEMSIIVDENDVRLFTSFLEGMERRTARQLILPILQRNLEPLVASERSYLSSHIKSGALSQSLSSRIAGGGRDRPNVMTAFSAPTATSQQLESTWRGLSARKQQRGWALPKKGRRARVFYGPIVHQGHRVVKRNQSGELYDTGKRVAALPFAQQAMDAMGDSNGELAATEIMNLIVGGM